ncbi:hypothetical protein L2E82_39972 [Cichorium intybus]|uniref:Uncharacterized protein n=1 Tax=Cichorium intybus TaxID=13427 RepID=A0ACB9AKG7_CICIN|nr:hypothetical protein L2E82_39972 [Cichorium intybus]
MFISKLSRLGAQASKGLSKAPLTIPSRRVVNYSPLPIHKKKMKTNKIACEGSLACSTCHVIVMDVEQYNKLEDPTDEENDMLDLAFGLTETSRLGCQVIAKPELDGLRLALPAATRNFAVDGYKPKPH